MRNAPKWVGKSASATFASRMTEELSMCKLSGLILFDYNGFRHRMLLKEYYLTLLVKLGVVAAIASVLARSGKFKRVLMRENRTLDQRLALAVWLSLVFAVGVEARLLSPSSYRAGDLGLEGSLIAGILGGYVTGLVSGILIALPAFFHHEHVA